jgi:tripartite-type tricarboxylate transporter receptor subunit TctC
MMLKHFCVASVLLTFGLAGTALAQDAKYPDRTVRIVVPYPPGGTTDVVGRIISDKLSGRLGQPFIVDNRPGAAGMIGSDMVAKSPPDGYTILMGSIANTTIPAVYSRVPYDLRRDLTPLCQVISIPNFMVVGESSPYKSVADVIGAAKANPGKLTFASSGTGASPHLSGELFKVMTGIDMLHIPYKGSGPAQIDLMGGRVSMMFDNAALPQIKGGKLRALAVSSPKRSAAAPDVPTVAEAGVSGYAVTSWYGLWVPKGTPQPVIDLLDKNIAEIFQDDSIKEKILGLGGDNDVACGATFSAFIDSELTKWSDLVKKANIKVEKEN